MWLSRIETFNVAAYYKAAIFDCEMIKICYVIGTLDIGGAEKQLLKLVSNINRDRFKPVLIALRGGILKADFEAFCEVHVVGKRWKFDPFCLFRLFSIIRRENPYILQTFMFTSNTWGRIAGIAARVPLIVASERSVDPWKRWHHRLIDRVLLLFTRLIVVNSESVGSFYRISEGVPGWKMRTVYNGVDPAGLQESPDVEDFLPGEDSFVVGGAGRFTEEKGFRSLLEAVPAVLGRFPGTLFILAGDGPLRKGFEDFSEEMGFKDSIIFTGLRKDIAPVLRRCNVVVAPSLYEGMPNVVLEAMALKKPVIVTDIPGMQELVTDGDNGFVVPSVNNAEKIAEKIALLAGNPVLGREMGERGYVIAREKFSLSGMVASYEDIYDSLNAGRDIYVRNMWNNSSE